MFRLASIKYLVCNVCLRFVKNSHRIQSESIVDTSRWGMWTNLWFVCTMPDIEANAFAAEASGNPCSRAFCCNGRDNEVYPRLALRSLFTAANKANCLIPEFHENIRFGVSQTRANLAGFFDPNIQTSIRCPCLGGKCRKQSFDSKTMNKKLGKQNLIKFIQVNTHKIFNYVRKTSFRPFQMRAIEKKLSSTRIIAKKFE